jgi:hypothetical protein
MQGRHGRGIVTAVRPPAPMNRLPVPRFAATVPRRRESAAALACVLLLALAVAWLDPGIAPAQTGLAAALRVLALNVLPALAAFGLLLALTRRLLLSAWLLLLALAGLYGANSAKLGVLQTPLLPADLRFLAEPLPAVHLFAQYLHVDAARVLLLGLGALLTALLLRERRLSVLAGWRAPVLALVALLGAATLLAGASPWRRLYAAAGMALEPWALSEGASHSGLLGSLLLYHWELGDGAVPPADRDAAIALLSAHAPELRAGLASAAAPGLPDIVVLQSESLFDPARLSGVPSDRWLREFHRLAGEGTSGELSVPTFAGGTIRTEFEALTGAPLASLGGVQYPWLELDREAYPGLARVLAGHGYATTAVHPNAAAFWNRARAYPALGFERFVDGEAFPKDRVVGLFTSDAALTERVLAELADEGPPQLVFAISMENHGPFDWRPGLDPARLAALPMPERLDAGARLWMGNYLYLLDDADHELGRLADALARRHRRTLLLFYGDHLPGLGPVYAQLGFDDGQPPDRQPVPWLLLDNRDRRPRHLDTASWMLPAVLLQAAGIGDDDYFNVLATLARSPDFDLRDDASAAGIDALARLHLRGELEPLLHDALGLAPARRD